MKDHRVAHLKKRHLALTLSAICLSGCGGGTCANNNSSNKAESGSISLSITAPNEYPAGFPITAKLSIFNTSNTNAANLTYSVPLSGQAGNSTGVNIDVSNGNSACSNIPALGNCTFNAVIPSGSVPGSFTVSATSSSVKTNFLALANSKIRSVLGLKAQDSTTVTRNIGVTVIPTNNYTLYLLPNSQTLNVTNSNNTPVYFSLVIESNENINTINIYDGIAAGSPLLATLSGGPFVPGQVLTFSISLPSEPGTNHVIVAIPDDCTLNCSNIVQVKLAEPGVGILNLIPTSSSLTPVYESQLYTLTNQGESVVSLISMPALSDRLRVSESEDCAATLSIGGSCTFKVNFFPQNVSESGESALHITYFNAKNTDSTTGIIAYSSKITTNITLESYSNSSYYVPQTAGMTYQAIQIQNTSSFPISLGSIPAPTGSAFESNPAYYLNNTKCNVAGSQSMAVGGSCVLLLKSTLASLGIESSNMVLNFSAGSVSTNQSFNVVSEYSLFTGGYFTQIGSVSTSSGYMIAKFNGQSWSDFTANGNPNRAVKALTFDTAGNLYAAGAFTSIGTLSSAPGKYLIAKYDGNVWQANLGEANDVINTLSFDQTGNLYAGGDFSAIGSISSTPGNYLLAKYNGSSWANAVTGGDANSLINAVTFDKNNNLYVGGEFNSIGGLSDISGGDLLAEYDGTSWTSPAIGHQADNPILGMAVNSQNELFVVGDFYTLGGITAPIDAGCNYDNNMCLFAKYTDGTWSNGVNASNPNNDGASNTIYAVATDGNNNLYTFTYSGGESNASIGNLEINGRRLLATGTPDGVSWTNVINNGSWSNPNGSVNAIALGATLNVTPTP